MNLLDMRNIVAEDISLHQRERFFFRQIAAIRQCEQKLLSLFSKGLIRGTIHTCLGQESCAVGVVNSLNKQEDIICSNHRGHGHYLSYSSDFYGLIAEIIGYDQGICGGIGGSQHLHNNNFYSNGILGGMPPVAVGMAMAEKMFASGKVVCVFLGDGAMAEGALYEALNIAGLWKAPVMFVVEHNQYAQTTHWSFQHAGKLEDRSKSFGVPVVEADGNDVEQVFTTSKNCVNSIRNGDGPQMLFLHTYRLGAHSKGEDHRNKSEIEANWEKDPLNLLQNTLDDTWCDEQKKSIANEIELLVKKLI